jgi:hypothetical protein
MVDDEEGTLMTTPPPPGGFPQYPHANAGEITTSKGFFGALFDFKFDHFITPMIVKVVYVVGMIVAVLAWLFWTVVGFAENPAVGIFVLIIGAVGAILWLAFFRMTLEFYLSIVRMSEDIHLRLPRG